VHKTGRSKIPHHFQLRGTMSERIEQLNSELRDLCTELESLQARALRRVECIENDFHGMALPSEVKEMFRTMQRLVTRV
jgi:hypothetical protein